MFVYIRYSFSFVSFLHSLYSVRFYKVVFKSTAFARHTESRNNVQLYIECFEII